MSEDTAPIVVTLKAGTGYDAPWLVIRGYDPDDVTNKLKSLDGVIEATLEAAGLFAAQRGLGATAPAPQAPAQQEQPNAATRPSGSESQGATTSGGKWSQQQGWGQTQQQSAPAQQGGQQQRKYGGKPHPEGKQCGECGTVLEYKETNSGKAKWQCPQWRWNNGNPNGHTAEWIN